MKVNYKTRIMSIVLAVFCVVLMSVPVAADMVDPQKASYNRVFSYRDTSSAAVIGGGSEPVEIVVFPSGSFGVFIDEYSPNYQYFDEYAYGSIWFIGNQQYSTEYLRAGNSSAGSDPFSTGSLGMGTLTKSGRTATVTWNLDNMVFSTSYTLPENSRTVLQSWSLTNNTGAAINGASLIAGGDTYFAGSDFGYALPWDEDFGISVFRDENSGQMNFLPATPADNYYSEHWSTGKYGAQSGQLPNTVREDYTDQSYYLQWDYNAIASGETRTIHAQQSFAEAGSLAGAPPTLGQSGEPGGTMPVGFQLTNTSNSPLTLSLDADGGDLDVSFSDASGRLADVQGIDFSSALAPNTVTIPPRSAITVVVYVTIPVGAAQGAHTITLTATDVVTGTSIVIPATVNVTARGVRVTAPANQSVSYGVDTDVYYTFDLSNNMIGVDADVDITAQSSSGYNVALDASSVNISAGDSGSVNATVSIPASAPANSQDQLMVTISFTDENGILRTNTATVNTVVGSGSQTGTIIIDGGTLTTGGYTSSGSSSGSSSSNKDRSDGWVERDNSLPKSVTQWTDKSKMDKLIKDARSNGLNYVRGSGSGTAGVRASAFAALNGFDYRYDNMDEKVVQLRIAINNPTAIKNDLLVSGWVKGAKINTFKATMEKWFSNDLAVIIMDQQGTWGNNPVTISARLDLRGMDASKLAIYAYDNSDNSYKLITTSNYHIDSKGYLVFSTTIAGNYIISEGLLAKR